jgi:hypothetical protein
MANNGDNIRLLKLNLKEKIYLYVNSTIHKGVSKKYVKLFWLKIFSFATVVHLELRITPRIFENNRSNPNGILMGFGGN